MALIESFKTYLYSPLTLFRLGRVCLWHSGRCGSTVLGDLLEQHPRIYWAGEVLEKYSKQVESDSDKAQAWAGGKKIIRREIMRGGAHYFGMEMKLWHMHRIGIDIQTVLDFLKSHKLQKNIVLERTNYLRVAVSGYVLQATRESHVSLGGKPKKPKQGVLVDLHDLINLMDYFAEFYNELKRLLPADSLWLSYEDDILPDPSIGYKKVINYCGLIPEATTVRLGRTNPQSLENIILNYNEVKNKLESTPYNWMLNG
jgi:hypothetical protein